MTLDELFENACGWKDGKCRHMRKSGTDATCCSWCKMYVRNGRRGCPFGRAEPPKCRAFLCDAARDWAAMQGGAGFAAALERLDGDITVMSYDVSANGAERAALGLGLGNALRRALAENGYARPGPSVRNGGKSGENGPT